MDTMIDLLFIIVPIIAGFLACISLYRYWKKDFESDEDDD